MSDALLEIFAPYFENHIEKEIEKGIEERIRKENIKSVIESLQEYGHDDSEIKEFIMKKFHMSEEEIEVYFKTPIIRMD